MTAKLVTLRQAVFDVIEAAKNVGSYSINDFELEQTYLPLAQISGIPASGKVYVIGLGFDETRITRGRSVKIEFPIQVAIQKAVNPKEVETINQYIELMEQLRETIRNPGLTIYQWGRTEALKDENGTPFNFHTLRQASTFEAYFTAYYLHTSQPA